MPSHFFQCQVLTSFTTQIGLTRSIGYLQQMRSLVSISGFIRDINRSAARFSQMNASTPQNEVLKKLLHWGTCCILEIFQVYRSRAATLSPLSLPLVWRVRKPVLTKALGYFQSRVHPPISCKVLCHIPPRRF